MICSVCLLSLSPLSKNSICTSCIAGVSQGSSFGSGVGTSPLTVLSQTHLFPVSISPFPFSFTVFSIMLCQCYRSGAKSKAIAPPQEGEQTLINYNEESRSSFSEVSVTAYIHTTHQCCVAECAIYHLFNYVSFGFGTEQNLPLSMSGELCSAWAG